MVSRPYALLHRRGRQRGVADHVPAGVHPRLRRLVGVVNVQQSALVWVNSDGLRHENKCVRQMGAGVSISGERGQA